MAATLQRMLESLPLHLLADIVASVVRASYQEKVDILNSTDLRDRWTLFFYKYFHKYLYIFSYIYNFFHKYFINIFINTF